MMIITLIKLFPYVIIIQFLQQIIMLISLKVFIMMKLIHIIGNMVNIILTILNNNIYNLLILIYINLFF